MAVRCRFTRRWDPGFLESVYEKALFHELAKAGLRTTCQKPIVVTYDEIVVGEFSADLFVEGTVIVETSIAPTDPPQNPSCKSG